MAKRQAHVRKRLGHFIDPYRVTARGFRLHRVDPRDTGGLTSEDKDDAKEMLRRGVELLSELQEKLWAQDRWALLLIFQAMDAAGKDSAVKHVMSGINPQGCEVRSFKAPSAEELDHDYLWRAARCLPARGMIGIFNRSYYEEVLVVRVHPEILAAQKLPRSRVGRGIWKERHEDIRAFERYLDRNGVVVRKFFLHVSKDEQRRRFLDRLDEPEKHWKFSPGDVEERGHWRAYMRAYEEAIRATATARAPWFVVPADNKWFTRLVVAAAIVEALEEMQLAFPAVPPERRAALAAARERLLGETRRRR
jgi:PPK2 family polyphosphate:nucleotide phosphotransferase